MCRPEKKLISVSNIPLKVFWRIMVLTFNLFLGALNDLRGQWKMCHKWLWAWQVSSRYFKNDFRVQNLNLTIELKDCSQVTMDVQMNNRSLVALDMRAVISTQVSVTTPLLTEWRTSIVTWRRIHVQPPCVYTIKDEVTMRATSRPVPTPRRDDSSRRTASGWFIRVLARYGQLGSDSSTRGLVLVELPALSAETGITYVIILHCTGCSQLTVSTLLDRMKNVSRGRAWERGNYLYIDIYT
jgi:hypothetical protein